MNKVHWKLFKIKILTLFVKHMDPSYSFICDFTDNLIMQWKIIAYRGNLASTSQTLHGLSCSI